VNHRHGDIRTRVPQESCCWRTDWALPTPLPRWKLVGRPADRPFLFSARPVFAKKDRSQEDFEMKSAALAKL
jgi:hypothetical protein